MSLPIIPFSFVRKEVTGPDFIGREKELRILFSNVLAERSTFVVGLPRMGKTSLVMQCFLEKKHQQEWLEVYGRFPLFVSVGACRNSASLWKSMATKIRLFLARNRHSLDVLERFHEYTDEEDMYQALLLAFDQIDVDLHLKPILILDEFDHVRNYTLEMDFFDKLRQISATLITCSRRSPAFIEESLFKRSYFTNNSDLLFIGPFNDDEVNSYWKHYSPYFSSFTREQFSSYRELVREYAGNHPMVISLVNNTLFKYSDQPFEIWGPRFPASQREEAERTIRQAVRDEFEWQMHYVEEQGLKKAAVQLVVGSSRAIPDESRDLLLNYRFLNTVPSAEKKRIFGYNLGPTTRDGMKRYVCFSSLTSHLMKDQNDPDIQGYDLLKTTELLLREMIDEYLKEICDYRNPYERELVKINSEEPLTEREIWEAVHYRRIRCFRTNLDASDSFLDSLDEMERIRNSREKNDCNPSFDRMRINKMTSTTLGQLWHVFIKWQWREYFSEILDPLRQHPGDGSLWHERVFRPIQEWRNAANHYHEDELSDQVILRAENLARSVNESITLWLGTRERS